MVKRRRGLFFGLFDNRPVVVRGALDLSLGSRYEGTMVINGARSS